MGVLLVVGGRLGDKFGQRKLFLIGIGGSSLASAAARLSLDSGLLIWRPASRSCQAEGAGAGVPESSSATTMAMLEARAGIGSITWASLVLAPRLTRPRNQVAAERHDGEAAWHERVREQGEAVIRALGREHRIVAARMGSDLAGKGHGGDRERADGAEPGSLPA